MLQQLSGVFVHVHMQWGESGNDASSCSSGTFQKIT